MKIGKYIAGISLLTILSLTGMILASAKEKAEIVDSKEILQSYDNLINESGIEHLTSTWNDGLTLDIYRDRNNGMERVDYYDENNMLVERSITTDAGQTFITLSQYKNDDNKWHYELTKSLSPKNAFSENKDLMKKSIIDSYFQEENDIEGDYEKVSINTDNNLIKYSNINGNIYINSNTKQITKREIISNGKLIKTLEVEVLPLNSSEIFKLDTPLMKENSLGEKKSLNEIIKTLKVNIEDYTDVEYDSSNGLG